MENNILTGNISETETFIKSILGESFDIQYRTFDIPAFNHSNALIVYIGNMTDTRVIDETILKPLISCFDGSKEIFQLKSPSAIQRLMKTGIFTSTVYETKTSNAILDAIIEGDTVLFITKCTTALIISTKKYNSRAVTEPDTESEIRGSKDAFIENIQVNVSLIRRRIKDYGLRFENMKIGERSKTIVSLAYIESLVNDDLLAEVKTRLSRIKIDSIFGSSNIEELIEDAPYSVFSQIANTERPDKACAAILEGRIAILVDNTPFVLIVPSVFWQFFLTSGDYYDRYYVGTFIRWIRAIAMFISTSIPAIYILICSYHQEMIPTALALKISSGRADVPYPAFVEVILMEIFMEIMQEAGLRMPQSIGMAVSIVGTLVIGQSAVSAGLASPFLVIMVALAAISSFAIPSYNMSSSLRLIRFALIFSTSMFDILGYLGGVIFILLHLMSLRSFGTPFLAPVVPFTKSTINVITRPPWWTKLNRSGIAKPKDIVRQQSGLKPAPPKKGE